jgi:endonuclease/exonuclease/phosphatase family metal-dependent hydrolase
MLALARARTGLLLIAGLVLGFLAVPAGVAHAFPDRDTYRVITYNTQLRGGIIDDQAYGIRNDTRATAIADRILAGETGDGPYDVVVLNEVFDEMARDILVNKLKRAFPHYVSKLDRPLIPDDSGLMLFSRYPIEPVPNSGAECFETDASGNCRVAFHNYDASHGLAEAFAAKGIGFVKINNPRSDQAGHVYFTHMQAEDDPDSKAARAAQVAEALTFINSWSGASSGADVIVAGDLNIPGGTIEHMQLVLGPQGFASLGLFDTWFRHMPATDPGRTFDRDRNNIAGAGGGTGGQRLDYVLYRPSVDGTACVQHLTVERHFRGTFTKPDPAPMGSKIVTQLSDHFPLAANLGKPQVQCSPVNPVTPTEGATLDPPDGEHARFMDWAGGFHWFRYTTPGTYSFSVQNHNLDNMVIDVFDATDLPRP